MGAGWGSLAKQMENGLDGFTKEILKEIGKAIGTIRPVYFSESSVGGYGIMFGNPIGMILAHVLLVIIGISAIVGFIVIISWFAGRKKKKMDPHEKWLRTGRMD